MTTSARRLLLAALAMLSTIGWAARAAAQLAPTGDHYAGRPSDTGFAMGGVASSGGYAASVPIEFPAARGNLPVPFALQSSAGVGAAGLGWDVPLSWVRRSTSFAHRRPQNIVDVDPQPRARVTLHLEGRDIDLVFDGGAWLARRDAPGIVLREDAQGWSLFDAEGRTYRFQEWPGFTGRGFWFLTRITAAGNDNEVALQYEAHDHTFAGGAGVSLDLVSLTWDTHPTEGCSKHQLVLLYGPDAPNPISLTMVGEGALVRMRTLEAVELRTRALCFTTAERVRRYELETPPDPDTGLPRLASVHVEGRAGTSEENEQLPVASFTYGTATYQGKLRYLKGTDIDLPADVDHEEIASSAQDWSLGLPGWVPYAGWQSLTDVTGDGRPDLVYRKNDKLWVALNRPGANGSTTIGASLAIGALSDATFTTGPLSARSSTDPRYGMNGHGANVDEVWRRAVDFNGDGRVDVIDAAEEPNRWVVYLNTPGSGNSGVTWRRTTIGLTALRGHLEADLHELDDDWLPLSRRYTMHPTTVAACWKWDGSDWNSYWQGHNEGFCPTLPGTLIDQGTERTYTEWELTDLNGDGYLDFAYNSSPVDVVETGRPMDAPGLGQPHVRATNFTTDAYPLDGDLNDVEAVFNVAGPRYEENLNVFSAPAALPLVSNRRCGVEEWAQSEFGTQSSVCSFADVNGDGVLDRVENDTAFLGTGAGFSQVTIALPQSLASQRNHQIQACTWPDPPLVGDEPYDSWQRAGLRDLNGDGIPDFVSLEYTTGWTARIGNGSGFGPPMQIEVPGSFFAFSEQRETCNGVSSSTTDGLIDIDGDGKPEVVHADGSGELTVYYLTGGWVARSPDAGRLVTIDNGYGAVTHIGYRSAKEDGTTAHQVPFAEIVVDSVYTEGTAQLGGDLDAVRYAYGDARQAFDPTADAFVFPAYGRTVALRVLGASDSSSGTATITDTYPLEPFNAGMTDDERFARYLLLGRVRDEWTLAGNLDVDAWSLLTTSIGSDPRRRAGVHHQLAAVSFDPGNQPGSTFNDCLDVVDPYSWQASVLADLGHDVDVCARRGFTYGKVEESWRGDDAPPGTSNVQIRTEVEEIDAYGRATVVFHHNDIWRNDDDVCTETHYAAPTGGEPRVLGAVSSRRTWDCYKSTTYASDSFEYDGLPPGQVDEGRLVAHTVDRRDTGSGALLGSIVESTIEYDDVGNATRTTSVRDDGAKRITELEYDEFGLAPVEMRAGSSDTPTFTTQAERDPVTLAVLSVTDENGTVRASEVDGFGRPVVSAVRPPGGPAGVVATTRYPGFGAPDAAGRRIERETFTDPVPYPDVKNTTGRISTVYLDELGRERRAEAQLGADYGDEVLVTALRTWDGLGRLSFEADPFPLSEPEPTVYGTTHHYRPDGAISCDVRGAGWQAFTTIPDAASERFPTCYELWWLNHAEHVAVRTTDSLDPAAPQTGVMRIVDSSAIGRPFSAVTFQGSGFLEKSTFEYDRLGNRTKVTRWQDPVTPANPVTWTSSYDSRGQRIRFQEPETALRSYDYDDFGALRAVRWQEPGSPGTKRSLTREYDGLGRLTRSAELADGVEQTDTVNEYHYDTGVDIAPWVTAENTAGRMTVARSQSSEVYLSYDAWGNVLHTSFAGDGKKYLQRQLRHFDGTLAGLELRLPDTGYQAEQAAYTYDSAGRMRAVVYSDGSPDQVLYQAFQVDPFGRVRDALYGEHQSYQAVHADTGRRLPLEETLSGDGESRTLVHLAHDAVGRESARNEIFDGMFPGPTTYTGYDALGRVASVTRSSGPTTLSDDHFQYDALGNLRALEDLVGTRDAWLSARTGDRDRTCRIEYGNGGLTGTACNVVHDAVGNVVEQPTRTDTRHLSYFASGLVRSIHQGASIAKIAYDAFGDVATLDVQGTLEPRHDRRFGAHLELRGKKLLRNIPGPGGLLAVRRGPGGPWTFAHGEARGNRHFTDEQGHIVQDVQYHPYGEAESKGAQPGTSEHTTYQWNGGDALAEFGLVQLGARMYDPVVGRFSSRDPLMVARSAATSNPYGFALGDPINRSDPSGLDTCLGGECQGGDTEEQSVPDGGPSQINWDQMSRYLHQGASGGAGRGEASPLRYQPMPIASFYGEPSRYGFFPSSANQFSQAEQIVYTMAYAAENQHPRVEGENYGAQERAYIAVGNARYASRYNDLQPWEIVGAMQADKAALADANARRVVMFGNDYEHWAASARVTPALVVPGAFEIWSHGDPGALGQRMGTPGHPRYEYTYLSTLLLKLHDAGFVPRQGMVIVLAACNTGDYNSGIAQRLADLTGSVVYAAREAFYSSRTTPANAPMGWKKFSPKVP